MGSEEAAAAAAMRFEIIDVSPLLGKDGSLEGAEDGAMEVVRKLDTACRETGFFYLKGHGIPLPLLRRVRAISRSFFDLPYEEKVKIKLAPETGFRGYQRIGENITLGQRDLQEAIDYYKEYKSGTYGDLGAMLEGPNLWPEHPSDFKDLMEEYVGLLKGKKIMQGIALALGVPADTFEGERAGDTFWGLRVLGYPSSTDATKLKMTSSDIGCGAHSDYGLLAFINQDDGVVALQVQDDAGEWIDVPPIPDTFICNIGNMLKIWSNGEYKSAVHRVVNKSPVYRVSVAFFYEPNLDASVEPLDFLTKRADGVAKFSKVVYGEYLCRKVLTNFGL